MPNQGNLKPFVKGFDPRRCLDGRKNLTVKAILKDIVENSKDGEVANAMARVAIQRALKGDVKFWNAIMDRLYGKATERKELTGADGKPIALQDAGPLDLSTASDEDLAVLERLIGNDEFPDN